MNLFESILHEADKTRFIKPIWDEYMNDPGQAMHEAGFNATLANELFPDTKTIIEWVNHGTADSLGINWQNLGSKDYDKSHPEFIKLLKGYVEWKQAGGSRKERKANAVSFSDTEKFYVLPIKNKNWLFVAPRNWEAAQYMDSYECGGQGAKWCIGYERSKAYWVDYNTSGSKFILALKKPNASKDLNFYFTDHGEEVKKYMIQIEYGEVTVWVPKDWAPSNFKNPNFFQKVFGTTAEALNNAYDKGEPVVNDISNNKPTFETLLNGTATVDEDGEDVTIYCEDCKELDLKKIINNFGEIKTEIKFVSCDIGKLICDDIENVDQNKLNLTFSFIDCHLDNVTAYKIKPANSQYFSRVTFSDCDIDQMYFMGFRKDYSCFGEELLPIIHKGTYKFNHTAIESRDIYPDRRW